MSFESKPRARYEGRPSAGASPPDITEVMKRMLEALTPDERERVLRELNDHVNPIKVQKPGGVLARVIKLLPKDKEWKVEDLRAEVEASGLVAKPKEIYNAVSYLARTGQVQRIGYGRYIYNGAEFITSDDLGCQDTRHEDAYRVDRDD